MSCEADSLDWSFVRSAVAIVEYYKHARFNPKQQLNPRIPAVHEARYGRRRTQIRPLNVPASPPINGN